MKMQPQVSSKHKLSALLSTILIILLTSSSVNAQVKIGDNPTIIDSTSLLELESNTKAFYPPRMSEAEMNAIPNPKLGAVVFNNDATCLYEYRGGTYGWFNLCQEVDGFRYGELVLDVTMKQNTLKVIDTTTPVSSIKYVPYDSALLNTLGAWDEVNYEYTAPVDGYYQVDATVGQRECGTQRTYRLGVTKPNSTALNNASLSKFTFTQLHTPCSAPHVIGINQIQRLHVGDKIHIQQRYFTAPYDVSDWNYDNLAINRLYIFYIGPLN